MKAPANCSPECAEWFRMTAKSQRETVRMAKMYPNHGFKSDLKARFVIRQSMLRNPLF